MISNSRTLTFIPLISNNDELRLQGIQYVDKYQQFSLNNLPEYKECINPLFSEVIKCLIATDFLAKMTYYRYNELWYWNDPTLKKSRFRYEYRETTKFISLKLFEQQLTLFEEHKKDMEIRVKDFYTLSREDIGEIASNRDFPLRYVACLTDNTNGFIAMIYVSLISKNNKKIMDVYGIRTTIFGIKEKGIAKSILNGIFQYAKILKVNSVHIAKNPIGPMAGILREMDFDDKWYKEVDDVEPLVNIVDLGCSNFIEYTDKYYEF